MQSGSAVFSHVSNRVCGDEKQPLVQVTLVNGWINTQTQRQTIESQTEETGGSQKKKTEINAFHSWRCKCVSVEGALITVGKCNGTLLDKPYKARGRNVLKIIRALEPLKRWKEHPEVTKPIMTSLTGTLFHLDSWIKSDCPAERRGVDQRFGMSMFTSNY